MFFLHFVVDSTATSKIFYNLRGKVKFLTGGILSNKRAHERLIWKIKVCRFGERPKPTVKVRMEED